MEPVTPEEWRQRVGAHLEARRESKRLSIRGAAKLAGISEGLWRQVESGQRMLAQNVVVTVNPKPATRAAICRAVGWSDETIDRLLAGEDPVEVEGPIDEFRTLVVEVERLARAVRVLTDEARERLGAEDEFVARLAALEGAPDLRQRP